MDGLYGQDGYEYIRYSISLKEYLKNGTPPGDYFWPVNYPFTGALISFIIPDIGFCLQLISSISLSLVIIYTYKTCKLIFPSLQINILLLIILLVTPFMVRFGITIMSDMFMLSLIIIGVYHILKYAIEKTTIHLLFGAILLVMAVMSRYAAIVIAIPLVIYGFITAIRQKEKWFWFLIIPIVALIPFIPHLIIRGENSVNFIRHEWFKTWSPLNFFSRKSESVDGIIEYQLPNMVYAFLGLFHPRYLFLTGVLILVGFRKFKLNKKSIILATSVFIYLVFLAGINYQNNRFLLLALPFTFIIFYPTIQHSLSFFGTKLITVFTLGVAVIQICLAVFSFKVVWNRNQLEKEVYEYVLINNTPIYTMDIDVALIGRGYSSPIYNIWKNYYESPDTNAIVIFNSKIFPEQWGGKKPMQNWNHFNNDYHLTEIHDFNSEWKVYAFK